MFSLSHRLFSLRNIVLLLLAVFTARSLGATIEVLDDFSQPVAITSIGLEDNARPIFNQDVGLFRWTRDFGVEFSHAPEGRTVAAEILDSLGMFVVSYGPGVRAETWLNYKAPVGMSFDMTMENAANRLALMVEFSQAPFDVEISLASAEGSSESHSFRQRPSFLAQEISLPLDLFKQVDLENVTSLEIALRNVEGQGAPDVVLSAVSLAGDSPNPIPEPSTSLLLLLAASGACLRRRRLRL